MTQRLRGDIQHDLENLDMVEWDRFTKGTDPDRGLAITVYGWIEREQDEYKDFVVLIYYTECDPPLIYYVTSSDEWTHEIAERLYGTSEGHDDCERVEDHSDVSNVVRIQEGGDD